MAGDWIKMRSDIYRDPKVSVMAESLTDRGGLLALYVNQLCQRDLTVTRNVMRNATVGALVSVWGVMRQRGKRCGDDLVCDGVTANVLDDVSDMPGFGDAMERAGWVEVTEDGIVFRRFFEEHNVDPAERAKAANAERQKRYRDRVKDAAYGDVTSDVTVTPREEKRRDTPKAPKGDVFGGGFANFWNPYPRKTAKVQAHKAWAKLNPSEALQEQILTALAAQCKSDQWAKDGGTFIPHASTWLNQRRWEDQFPASSVAPKADIWAGAV